IGLNNTFSHKNVDLNVFAYGVFDQLAFNGVKHIYNAYSCHVVGDGTNRGGEAARRWSCDNPRGVYPSDPADSYVGHDASTREDATFFRVKNITLGYNFPSSMLTKEISRLRVYLDIQNPVVFTKWTGMAPEIAGANKAPYPNQRSYSLG